MSKLVLALACAALVGAPASAVTIDWVTVGDPGNACDVQAGGCFGAVDYVYKISKYEVTNAQYAEFLNAVAAADPNGLYDTGMESTIWGGITRSGTDGSYTYAVKAGFADKPVDFVSFWDALRFANWIHNGQPTGAQDSSTTEDGAYTITAQGIVDNSITRNAGATIFLTSEDEWYKAAYYDAVSATYFDYPTGTDAQTGCVLPASDTGNSANCWPATSPLGALTDVGAYPLSGGPYGTFDQGGNVSELNEVVILGLYRGLRGGSWLSAPNVLAASLQGLYYAAGEDSKVGFRVASLVPEPGAGLLVMTGLLGVAGWRRRRG